MDSNLLPTLLAVEPVSNTVSTLPVNTFSRPILKSTQLSFLMALFTSLDLLPDVSRGDSQLGQFFCSQGTTSTSSSSIDQLKQTWFNAQFALILSRWFFFSIRLKRSRALGSRELYYGPQQGILLALFWERTSLQVLPGKALLFRSRMWKISPRLKISQIGSYLVFMSLMLITSGATYPGVPHLTNRYSSASENSARPKSAMTKSQLPGFLKIKFQGLRSLCMAFFQCISLRPLRIDRTISLIQWALNFYLALTLS